MLLGQPAAGKQLTLSLCVSEGSLVPFSLTTQDLTGSQMYTEMIKSSDIRVSQTWLCNARDYLLNLSIYSTTSRQWYLCQGMSVPFRPGALNDTGSYGRNVLLKCRFLGSGPLALRSLESQVTTEGEARENSKLTESVHRNFKSPSSIAMFSSFQMWGT